MPKDTYEVGYKKPPAKTKFKKEQSGNPKGRPKGSVKQTKSTDVLEKELMNKITVIENGKALEITLLEAIQKRLVTDALKGNQASMRIIQKLLGKLDLNIHENNAEDFSIKIQFVEPIFVEHPSCRMQNEVD